MRFVSGWENPKPCRRRSHAQTLILRHYGTSTHLQTKSLIQFRLLDKVQTDHYPMGTEVSASATCSELNLKPHKSHRSGRSASARYESTRPSIFIRLESYEHWGRFQSVSFSLSQILWNCSLIFKPCFRTWQLLHLRCFAVFGHTQHITVRQLIHRVQIEVVVQDRTREWVNLISDATVVSWSCERMLQNYQEILE